MIKGIGVDIVEIGRIERIVDNNSRFVTRILSKNEQQIFNQISSTKRKMEFLAGRFAAKEAYSKAIGTGIGEVGFQDIEILPDAYGAPILFVKQNENDRSFVSISHSDAYAVAQVVIETV